MAFTLLPGNLKNTSVIDRPAGVIAGPDNFINLYTVADKYEQDLHAQLHMANGRGKITSFLKMIGAEDTYASDSTRWAEEGRLEGVINDVARTVNAFVSPDDHNLTVGDIVKISDGTIEAQATVTAVTNAKEFTATNDDGTAFSFTGNVSVICDFSNSYEKGSDDATQGKRWEPETFENFTHIFKKVYNVSVSDMIHESWIMTPDGPRWYNHEIENTNIQFENGIEYTQMFHERKVSGNARGVRGVLSQIEEGGNIGNEYLSDIEEFSQIALRAKQNGGCTEFTVWHDHTQGAKIRQMLAGVNSHYAAGGNYGTFGMSKDTAMKLGFGSMYIDGITFHFRPWDILDSPTQYGADKFKTSSLACLIVPSGTSKVTIDGQSASKPYLSVMYRGDAKLNRRREIKLFGPNGTPHKKDISTTHFTSEFTNRLIGANQFFAVRKGAGFYS